MSHYCAAYNQLVSDDCFAIYHHRSLTLLQIIITDVTLLRNLSTQISQYCAIYHYRYLTTVQFITIDLSILCNLSLQISHYCAIYD